MATVKGIREKVHYPLYDSVLIPALYADDEEENVERERMLRGRRLKFFVNVQNKTILDTNMEAAGVLPAENSYEIRALRLILGPAPESLDDVESNGGGQQPDAGGDGAAVVDDEDDWEPEELIPSLISSLLYSSVLSLVVGEKTMIQAPSFMFPSGSGVNNMAANGQPDPMATFRFAEPIIVDRQQNFRVELELPYGWPADWAPEDEDLPAMRIWVMLDGYLTRSVQ